MESMRKEFRLERGKDRLFAPFDTFMIVHACLARSLISGGPIQPGDYFWHQSRVFENTEVRLPLFGPVEYLLAGKAVSFISIKATAMTQPNGPRPDENVNVLRLFYNAIAPTFTEFYENNVEFIREVSGNEPSGWPLVWSFARVIRNTFAHGGQVSFNSRNAAPVEWHGLRFSFEDNGRRIVGTDLEGADLMVLLLEMNEALHAIGGPAPEDV